MNEFESGVSRDTYRARRELLDSLAPRLSAAPCVNVLPALYQGRDPSAILPLLDKMTREDKEGLMANLDAPYLCRRNSGVLKIKRFHTMDLPILRCVEGTGELAGTLGALVVDFDGNEVGVGTGFTLDERLELWRYQDSLPGTLCEVKYKEVTANKNGGRSLQFPSFVSLRRDKLEVSKGPDRPAALYTVLFAPGGQACLSFA